MIFERKWKYCTDDQKAEIRALCNDLIIRDPEDIVVINIINNKLVGYAMITKHFPPITQHKSDYYVYNLITTPGFKAGHNIMLHIEKTHKVTVHVHTKNQHAFKFFLRRKYTYRCVTNNHYELEKSFL